MLRSKQEMEPDQNLQDRKLNDRRQGNQRHYISGFPDNLLKIIENETPLLNHTLTVL